MIATRSSSVFAITNLGGIAVDVLSDISSTEGGKGGNSLSGDGSTLGRSRSVWKNTL